MTGSMPPGRVLAERWQIQDFLGSGDTGEVYGVADSHGIGAFALKLFWPSALAGLEVWPAFQQQARSVSSLRVEGVARAHDFGIDMSARRPFVVVERVSWPSLAERIRTRRTLKPEELATALEVAARALDAAHAARIVHRDLKPENLFISPENPSWVRITDFGTTRLRAVAPPAPGWGATPGWCAPDAADPGASATPAMDVYALGLLVFFALTGSSPHRAGRVAPIDTHALWAELGVAIDSAAARAREVGRSIDAAFDPWFARALAPSPDSRFGSVGEMARNFAEIQRGLPAERGASGSPGIAAAIAAPLLFQSEAPPPSRTVLDSAKKSPALSGAGANWSAAPALPAALRSEPPKSVDRDQKRTLSVVLGGAALGLLAVTVIAAAALTFRGRPRAQQAAQVKAAASAAALASASAGRAERALTAAPGDSATVPASPSAPSASAAATESPAEKGRVRFRCVPGCDFLVCDGESIHGFDKEVELAAGDHTCIASKYGFGSKEATFTVKVAALRTVDFVLTLLQADLLRKPGAAVAPPAPNNKAQPKKKCGTTFLPCK